MSEAAAGRGRTVLRGAAAAVIVMVMLVSALSLWTAIPLAWVYAGSKLSQTQFPSGGPYMVVLVGIVVSIAAVAWLLARLNRLYIRVTGTNTVAPLRPVWLRSVRDSGPQRSPTVLETVMLGSVLLAGLAAALWFFLLAGSPLPNQ